MHIYFYCIVILLTIVSLPLQGASLIDLKINFENDSWKEFLSKAYGQAKYKTVEREKGNKCLQIPHGIMLRTKKFKYFKGKIKVSLKAKTTKIIPGKRPWQAAWCSVYLLDGQDKEIGHHDIICTGKPTEWKKYSQTLKSIRKDVSGFYITVGNVGKSGTLWIDDLDVKIEVDGKQLCGDPGFNGAFAVDHWYCPTEGTDWDKLKLAANTGKARYQTDRFPDSGKSLYMKNTATFQSSRYTYNGESLIFGGWVKQKNIKTGIRGWAESGVQLIFYNEQGRVIGHRDVSPLQTGSFKWQYFSTFIPAGSLRRDVAYIEIWPRIFEGATGEAWFDQLQLIKLSDSINDTMAYNTTKATITINANRPSSKIIRPVWNSTDISYFMAIKEEASKKALAMMRKNGVSVLRCREFLKGGKILKKINSNGTPVYDWRYLDSILDWAVKEQNFTLTATIESTPEQIASKPSRSFVNRNAPKNFKLWGKIAEDLVCHWIERYGLGKVKKWHFECWNEPIAASYYWGTAKQFVKIFNEYIDALKRVEQKYNTRLNIATFSGTAKTQWYKMIFDNLQKNGKLSNINMISMHIYGGYVNSFSCLKNYTKRIQSLVALYPELKEAPLILTEVNATSMANSLNDSSVAAAWNVKANLVYLDNRVKAGYFFSAIDYLYNRSNQEKYFCGYLGAFTKAGTPKPVFNSIILLNKLRGGMRIPLKSSNEPIDGIAVRDKDKVKILLTSFDETKLHKNINSKIETVISWNTKGKNIQATLYRVDKNHANSYTTWLKMGKPKISKATSIKLEKANQLIPEKFTNFEIKNNKLKFNLSMPVNSILYLEFKN